MKILILLILMASCSTARMDKIEADHVEIQNILYDNQSNNKYLVYLVEALEQIVMEIKPNKRGKNDCK